MKGLIGLAALVLAAGSAQASTELYFGHVSFDPSAVPEPEA